MRGRQTQTERRAQGIQAERRNVTQREGEYYMYMCINKNKQAER